MPLEYIYMGHEFAFTVMMIMPISNLGCINF